MIAMSVVADPVVTDSNVEIISIVWADDGTGLRPSGSMDSGPAPFESEIQESALAGNGDGVGAGSYTYGLLSEIGENVSFTIELAAETTTIVDLKLVPEGFAQATAESRAAVYFTLDSPAQFEIYDGAYYSGSDDAIEDNIEVVVEALTGDDPFVVFSLPLIESEIPVGFGAGGALPPGDYRVRGEIVVNSFFDQLDTASLTFLFHIVSLTGDCDEDGDIDLVDFGSFQLCFSGAGPAAPGCECADFDQDGDVDLIDFGEFQLAFTG